MSANRIFCLQHIPFLEFLRQVYYEVSLSRVWLHTLLWVIKTLLHRSFGRVKRATFKKFDPVHFLFMQNVAHVEHFFWRRNSRGPEKVQFRAENMKSRFSKCMNYPLYIILQISFLLLHYPPHPHPHPFPNKTVSHASAPGYIKSGLVFCGLRCCMAFKHIFRRFHRISTDCVWLVKNKYGRMQ